MTDGQRDRGLGGMRHLHHALVDRVGSSKPDDPHRLLLSHAMAAVHGLLVRGRIEVGIVNHDRVCGSEVDAEPPRASGEQEAADGVI